MNYINIPTFKNVYEYILRNNTGRDNPYYNNEHCLKVFESCMFLFDLYRKEYNLKSIDRFKLGIAALFHDFNHSGGKLKDSDNIKLALDGLKEYMKNDNFPVEYEEISELIKCTEFPYKEEVKGDILKEIIRYSDMSGALADNQVNHLTSLSSELNRKLFDFIPIQIEYLKNLKYYTPYYNETLDKNRERIIVGLIKLKNQLF